MFKVYKLTGEKKFKDDKYFEEKESKEKKDRKRAKREAEEKNDKLKKIIEKRSKNRLYFLRIWV